MKRNVILALMMTLLVPTATLAGAVVVAEVPAYNWYHGCAPTAAASVVGYWDLHGYPNLFAASGQAVYLTSNVQDQISSPQHNAKYDYADVPSLPASQTSIADAMGTSVDPAGFGGTSVVDVYKGLSLYPSWQGYAFSSITHYWEGPYASSFLWNVLITEINLGRPLVFAVNMDGQGADMDHAVAVLGYDDRGSDGLWYGLYTTWSESETVVWKKFAGYRNTAWGVGAVMTCDPVSAAISAPVPLPGTIILLAPGLLGLITARRRTKKTRGK